MACVTPATTVAPVVQTEQELRDIAKANVGDWVVYVLSSVPSPCRTYAGVTNDWPHRFRQHNGEIKGGARATMTGKPWKLAALAYGFKGDKSMAMRYEWFTKVKHYKGKLAGRTGPLRRAFLLEHARSMCPDCDIKVGICDPNMLSSEQQDRKKEEVKAQEEKRGVILNIVL